MSEQIQLNQVHPALAKHYHYLAKFIREDNTGLEGIVGEARAWACAIHYAHEYQRRGIDIQARVDELEGKGER